ncbi:hypothetical protein [Streptomyces sp. NPDC059757]|uniref:hypothetical protein n=1 Tax=Streptomyces sp. NPDC059757 TaxID=3346935 RepID=UPI003664894F
MHFAAIGWADRDGHAAFQPNELACVLVDRNGAIPSKQSVSGAVRRAKVLDLVAAESNATCLVLPQAAFRKEKGAPKPCRPHPDRR